MNAKTDNAPLSAEATEKVALAKLYTDCAKVIGNKAKAIETARGGLWKAGILAGVAVAVENGHTPETFHEGLRLACEDQDIPRGSWSSYLATAKNLLADIIAGKITLEAVKGLSIQEARERYAKPKAAKADKPEASKAEGEETAGEEPAIDTNVESSSRRALLSALATAVTKLTNEQLAELVMLAESQAQDNDTSEEEETGEPVKQAA